MSQKIRTNEKIRFITRGAVIAALYVVLTQLAAALGLSGQSAVQVRFSEMLTVLPYFTAAAIPGLTIGCLLANILTGAAALDIIFGTLATLLGALGTYFLRKYRYLAPIPPIVANTVIVPFVIKAAYVDVEDPLGFLFLTVGAGEVISAGVLGILLLLALDDPRRFSIFYDKKQLLAVREREAKRDAIAKTETEE